LGVDSARLPHDVGHPFSDFQDAISIKQAPAQPWSVPTKRRTLPHGWVGSLLGPVQHCINEKTPVVIQPGFFLNPVPGQSNLQGIDLYLRH
jgi:hypothetical protein